MMKTTRKRMRMPAALAALALTAAMPLSVQSVIAPLTAYAEESYTEGSNDQFYYQKYADHVVITSGKTMEMDTLEIPESIDGVPVTEIGIYAFELCTMKTLILPDSIKVIESYTFEDCPNLTSVKLPANIEYIGFHAFEDCEKLATVEFPDHLVKTANFTFDNTPWLEEQRKKDPLVIINDAVIDGRTCEGDVKIPSNVKYVAAGAFQRNDKITSCVIPAGVTEIASEIFWYCANLTSVELKGSETIAFGTFGACNRLTDLKVSGKLKSIDYYSFTDNTATATITFRGSQSAWNAVEKPAEDQFLQRAQMVFDENYQEEELPEDNPGENPKLEPTLLGDVNEDERVTVSDAILLARIIAEDKGAKVTDQGKLNGDVDGVSGLSPDDTTMILKYIAGLTHSWGVAE